MISDQKIRACIDEVHAISKIDLCVLKPDGTAAASTLPQEELPEQALVKAFLLSPADSQTVSGCHFFKIDIRGQTEYVLAARGLSADAGMVGRLTASQLRGLILACESWRDRHEFMRALLLDRLTPSEIFRGIRKFRLKQEAERTVFLIETKYEQDEAALSTVRGLFGHLGGDFITTVDERHIVLVKELSPASSAESPEHTARVLVDMLNAEAMTQVRVAYGCTAARLEDLVKAYGEARTAMEVGHIFYAGRTVMAYEKLGIGRLIYHLPEKLCTSFVQEVLGEETEELLDDETLGTIHRFFENGLNMSETARQLHVHRNTLIYRLEKLQKATGLDIRVFEDAMTLQIALMALGRKRYLSYNRDNDGCFDGREQDDKKVYP